MMPGYTALNVENLILDIMNDIFLDLPTNVNLSLEGKHRCELKSPDKAYGIAIQYCYEDVDGKLWAGNIEYESQVNYCPICGFEAKTNF